MKSQSHIEQLIRDLCPAGVVIKTLADVTYWDKKFNGVDKSLQPKTFKYHYYLASELEQLESDKGTIRILYTSSRVAYAEEKSVKENIAEAEVVCIPWGGNANIRYYKGKFVTADNRIAVARDPKQLNTKFLYYWLAYNQEEIDGFYRGAGIKHPSMLQVLNFPIPLPPLQVQEEIVQILDTFANLINNIDVEIKERQWQYEHSREQLFEGIKGVSTKKLEEFATAQRTRNRQHITENAYSITQAGLVPTKSFFKEKTNVTSSDTSGYYIVQHDWFVYSPSRVDVGSISYLKDEGPVIVSPIDVVFSIDTNICLPSYLLSYFFTREGKKNLLKNREGVEGTGRRNLPFEAIQKIDIPLPPIEEQKAIIAKLETIDALVANLREERDLRQKQYEHYREQLISLLK